MTRTSSSMARAWNQSQIPAAWTMRTWWPITMRCARATTSTNIETLHRPKRWPAKPRRTPHRCAPPARWPWPRSRAAKLRSSRAFPSRRQMAAWSSRSAQRRLARRLMDRQPRQHQSRRSVCCSRSPAHRWRSCKRSQWSERRQRQPAWSAAAVAAPRRCPRRAPQRRRRHWRRSRRYSHDALSWWRACPKHPSK